MCGWDFVWCFLECLVGISTLGWTSGSVGRVRGLVVLGWSRGIGRFGWLGLWRGREGDI